MPYRVSTIYTCERSVLSEPRRYIYDFSRYIHAGQNNSKVRKGSLSIQQLILYLSTQKPNILYTPKYHNNHMVNLFQTECFLR